MVGLVGFEPTTRGLWGSIPRIDLKLGGGTVSPKASPRLRELRRDAHDRVPVRVDRPLAATVDALDGAVDAPAHPGEDYPGERVVDLDVGDGHPG